MLELLETFPAASVALTVKVYVPFANGLETVIVNEPLELAVAVPI